MPFARFLINSVIISVCTVAFGLIVNSMAAFALSRIKFRGQKIILGIILATLIVPFETMALPLLWWVEQAAVLRLRQRLHPGLAGHLPGPDRAVHRQRVLDLPLLPVLRLHPEELDEAATVDGAGWFRIYRSIIMPLSGPAIATVAILTFLPPGTSTCGR